MTTTDLGAAWRALAVLTLARASMGIQFQSVPALSEPLGAATGLGPVAMGWLVGLYLLPGVVLSFAGGWLGGRYGDIQMVRIGVLMMTVGAAIMLIFEPLPEFFGRVLSGSGGILLNVLVTKIVADAFPPRRLPVAMSILISSWPIGLAFALAVLPPLEQAFGLQAAMALPLVLSGACLLMLRSGSAPSAPPPAQATAWPSRPEVWLSVLAGGVWAFYNVAFILLLVFGPAFVASRGVNPVEAAGIVSMMGAVFVIGLIAGGWITTRIKQPDAVMFVGFGAIAVGVAMLWTMGTSPWLWVTLGLVFGPPGGAIMALPARAIEGPARSIGFGIYFTVYYVLMPLGPPFAALMIAKSGTPDSALPIVLASLALATTCLVLFRLNLPGRAPAGEADVR